MKYDPQRFRVGVLKYCSTEDGSARSEALYAAKRFALFTCERLRLTRMHYSLFRLGK